MQEKIYAGHINKAFNVFEKFRKNLDTDQEKIGAIHSFKCCYILAWKLAKRALEKRNTKSGSPKDTFEQKHSKSNSLMILNYGLNFKKCVIYQCMLISKKM